MAQGAVVISPVSSAAERAEFVDYGYRIHGTPEWFSIGKNASSGCIRMINQDVMDLFERVPNGTKVIVLPMDRRADNADGKRG